MNYDQITDDEESPSLTRAEVLELLANNEFKIDFTEVRISGTDLSRLAFISCKFTADLSNTDFTRSIFSNPDFSGATNANSAKWGGTVFIFDSRDHIKLPQGWNLSTIKMKGIILVIKDEKPA